MSDHNDIKFTFSGDMERRNYLYVYCRTDIIDSDNGIPNLRYERKQKNDWNLKLKMENGKLIKQGNRMKKSLIFVQNYLFFAYDLTKNIIIGS